MFSYFSHLIIVVINAVEDIDCHTMLYILQRQNFRNLVSLLKDNIV